MEQYAEKLNPLYAAQCVYAVNHNKNKHNSSMHAEEYTQTESHRTLIPVHRLDYKVPY